MRTTRSRLGLAFVGCGLLINPWVIGMLVADDGAIDGMTVSAALMLVGTTCLLTGLQSIFRWVDALAWTNPVGPAKTAAVVVTVALLTTATYARLTTYITDHTHMAVVPTGHDHATPEQHRWAQDFYRRSLDAATRNGWFDLENALAQGFQVDRVNRTHFPNQQYLFDDVILDPERPEWLIYADSPNGKVLMGFMFFTRALEEVGPTPGGPLAEWHYHPYDTPRCAVQGLWTVARPDGNGHCAEGILVSRTPEMFHVWFMDHPLGRFSHMNLVPEYWDEGRFSLGQLHPAIVHFAIALFVISVLLDFGALVLRREQYHHTAWINLVIAAIATLAAVALGMSAELSLTPTHAAHQTLDSHKSFAYATLVGVLLLTTWRFLLRGRFPQRGAALYLLASLASVGAISVAGYYGGEMVYGHGAGVRALNQFARTRYWEAVDTLYRTPAIDADEDAAITVPSPSHAGH